MRDTYRGRDTGRERSRLPAGSPMWDSIVGLDPGTWGSRPEPQALNHGATQVPLKDQFYERTPLVIHGFVKSYKDAERMAINPHTG